MLAVASSSRSRQPTNAPPPKRRGRSPHQIASDPNTPPERLDKMAAMNSKPVQRCVAKNPNASLLTLAALVTRHATRVERNPVLPIYELMGQTTEEDRQAMLVIHTELAKSAVGSDVLKRLAHHPDAKIRESVAYNVHTPPEVLDQMARQPDGRIRIGVAHNLNTSAETLHWLVTEGHIGFEDDQRIAREVAEHRHTSPACLAELSTHPCEWARKGVAENSNTPVRVLMTMMRADPEYHVRKAAAANPTLSLEKLVQYLALDPNEKEPVSLGLAQHAELTPEVAEQLREMHLPRVTRALAENRKTPPDVLRRIATSSVEARLDDVQRCLAFNPASPPDVLALFVRSRDSDVRRALASNEGTGPATLARLARDRAIRVVRDLAENPNTPPEVLAALVQHKDRYVRLKATRNPSLPVAQLEPIATHKEDGFRMYVALNPSAPTSLLRVLAKDDSQRVRSCVAQHPSTEARVLCALAKDEDHFVRACVSENPSCPAEAWAILANDPDTFVLRRLLESRHAPADLVAQIKAAHPRLVRGSDEDDEPLPTTAIDLPAVELSSA